MLRVIRRAGRLLRNTFVLNRSEWSDDEAFVYVVVAVFAFLLLGFPHPAGSDLGWLRGPVFVAWMSFAVVATLLAGRLVLWLYRAAKRAGRSTWESALFRPIRAVDAALRLHLIPSKDASRTDVWLYGITGFIAFMTMAGLTRVVLVRAPGLDIFPVLAVWIVLWVELSVVVAMVAGITITRLRRSIGRAIARHREETTT